MLKEAFLTGAKCIEAQKEEINELNVFPVPDGDTGTNMTLTFMSAAKEVYGLEDPTMEQLAKAISSGSLRGARGNSGVILSQLLRGFTKVIKTYTELTPSILADAFDKAVETAYKAVMKPKEGTILTVARGGAERAREIADTEDLEYFCDEILKKMDEVLDYTPELLPVLKEAGVVDSGGKGLVVVLYGAVRALKGNPIPFEAPAGEKAEEKQKPAFTYSVEFSVGGDRAFNDTDVSKLRSFLESIGGSVVVISDMKNLRVCLQTNDPGAALTKAVGLGTLTGVNIVNMLEEKRSEKACCASAPVSENKPAIESAAAAETPAPAKDEPRRKDGFIAVSTGEGLNEIFKSLGADFIIQGGQTMNPSTEDFLKAIDCVNADNVYVFPNNSNIILAANQAKALTKDKNVIVIPSRSIPQGITALINYIYDNSVEDNEEGMKEALKTVKTGQVTYAVRDTSIDGFDIKQNDIMGLDDKTIKAVGSDTAEVAIDLIKQMIDDDSSFITVYYGSDVAEDEVKRFTERVSAEFGNIETEVHSGGQPIYYYIISVE
ncbi:MAG: DAK2 domain-containing protein [Lachnospiraceae bacterium]|nr:DAK2 domain-containing protein [Lachnospiraceae bacterium]